MEPRYLNHRIIGLPVSDGIIDEFLSECGEDISSMDQAFETFSMRQGFDVIKKAISSEGSPISERIGIALVGMARSVFSSPEPLEHELQFAYIESFKLSSHYRKVFWKALHDQCKERGVEDWAKTFQFIYQAERGDTECWEEIKKTKKLLSEVIIPPMNTVHNYETAVMSEARFSRAMDPSTIAYMTAYSPKEYTSLETMGNIRKQKVIRAFSDGWMDSGFARIEIGHKLAAALCLTDIPEIVESPWNHWSLIIPTDMFSLDLEIQESHIPLGKTKLERLWCVGSSIHAVVYRMHPTQLLSTDPEDVRHRYIDAPMVVVAQEFKDVTSEPMKNLHHLLNNLVRGICLSVTDKKQERKGSWGRSTTGSVKKKKNEGPGIGERYFIGKPISIDLREELERIASGKHRMNSGPKFQFLVRGHFRNQPYGPGREKKRRQWIEPFWKGDEETRVLLRPYEIKEEP